MKSPPLPRPKKPPSPQKLKLLCSFNGTFASTGTSTAPRYVGGEARIVSLAYPITLSRLLSKLSDLRPKHPFTILHQRPDSASLLPIATDDDVRCMIEDHDRGKAARLRLYLVHVQEPSLYGTKISGSKDSVVDSRTQIPKMGSSQFSVSNKSTVTSGLLDNQSFAHSRIKTQHASVGDMSNGRRSLVEKGSSPVSFNNQPDWGFIHSKVLGGNVMHPGIGHARVRNQRCGGIGPYHVRDTRMGSGDFGVPRCEKVCTVKGARSNVSKIGQGRTHCNNLAKPVYVGVSKGLVRDHVVQGCSRRSLVIHHRPYPDPLSCYPCYLHPGVGRKPTSNLAMASIDDGLQSKHIIAERTGYHTPWEDKHPIMETKNCWNHAESNANHSHNLNKELHLAKPVDRSNLEACFSANNTLSVRKNTEVSDVNTFPRHDIGAQLYDSNICDEKPSPDVALHNLSLWDSPEVHQASPCAPLSICNVVEPKDYAHNVTGMCAKDDNEVGSNLLQCYPHLRSEELQTIKNSDIEEIRVLGTGAYGTVFYGKWKGSDVAIKRLKPSCFSGDELGKDRLVADFWKEARLLGQLHHPNVVAFYGVVTDGSESNLAINLATVTEYMVNGSLKQVLQKKDRTIDRRKRLIIAMHAAFGMEYLHEKNVVHFDLKSHNLLVNMKDPLRPICKIGDLGLSKVKQRTLVSGGVRGTIPWMAPELFNCTKTNMVTEKVDVYSFGIVMWELLTGEEPYANKSSEEIVAGIIEGQLRPDIPSWCDPEWRSLMERCWTSDPSSRPSFAEIAKELRAIGASINIK